MLGLPTFDELRTAPIIPSTVIPEERSFSVITTTPAAQKKTKVGCYVRVSSQHEDQKSSIAIQRQHFLSQAAAHEDWEFAGIYCDMVSGTKKESRPELQRLLRDCEAGNVQLVLTKSISRFARNTTDLLDMVRSLTALGAAIIFDREHIDTRTMDSEFLLTLLASLAEDESRSISSNCRWGIQKRFQDGTYKISTAPYGYDVDDGRLVINEEEAKVVREIFTSYLDGLSLRSIADILNSRAIPTKRAGEEQKNGRTVEGLWTASTIGSIEYLLKNEKFSGDLLLQKYYTVDFLTKKTAVNNGQVPQYLAENNHDPVIPKAVFLQAQAEMARRRQNPRDGFYLHDYALSGRVVCGECGTRFRRVIDKRYNTVNWRCEAKISKAKHPGVECHNKGIRESVLKNAVIEAFNHLPEVEAELVRLDERLKWAGLRKADELLENLRAKMEGTADQDELDTLQSQWVEANSQRAIYADKELQIRNLLQRIKAMQGKDVGERDSAEHGVCADPEEFWRITRPEYQPGPVTQFPDDEVIRFVEQIVVTKEKFTVMFKAGMSIEVNRE